MSDLFAIKGTFIYTPTKTTFRVEVGYMIVEGGISKGIFPEMPTEYGEIPIEDYTGQLIIPGFSDLHLHGPQYPLCANGMDLELLDWLETYTFPQESKFKDTEYAREVYTMFVNELTESFTTRACIFGTIHTPSNLVMMDLLEDSGLMTYVGKVNMDRNCPDIIREVDAETSWKDTIDWIEAAQKQFIRTKPIITPRFIPVCSDELMNHLGDLKKQYQMPYQSHLSENPSEIAWIKELCPESRDYTDAYDRRGAFSEGASTVMAHCVYLTEKEEAVMKEKHVFIAHCPDSNMNVSSGIAPIRKYLDNDLNVGLGSDIGGGASLSMFYVMRAAIQSSKMYWRLIDTKFQPLTLEEVFYMGTKGGGAFFGKVGSFEEGYQVDALVLKDYENSTGKDFTPQQRLEKLVYLGNYSHIVAKYVGGEKLK